MINPAEPVIGGLMIELCFGLMLYGITTLQAFMYFQNYTKDPLSLKALVASVWIIESVHTGFCMQMVYAYLILGFGDFETLMSINWGIGITVLCSTGVALCVQGYYTWRVWIVSGKHIVWTVIIGFFTFLRVGFGIGTAALCYVYPRWITFRANHAPLVTLSSGLGSAALVDMLVAITLSYYLKYGRQNWHRDSNSMINRILLYTINTGALTGAASLLCVILFAIKKDSLVFYGLVIIETKLYANSLLGSLNARAHMRGKGSQSNTYSSGSRSNHRIGTPRTPAVVEVFQQTNVLDDREATSEAGYSLTNLKGGELA